jgi:branched-chain amino acid transport system permease protein
VMLLALVALPAITTSYASATNVLILTLAAAAFNLVFGYAGMLSLGHAALYGAGAYACGLSIVRWSLGWANGIALAMGCGLALALVIGTLAIRTRGIYFGMVTLALAECFHFAVFQASWLTGGDNGLRGINVSSISFIGTPISLIHPANKYYFMAVFVGIALWLISRILASPFGSALEAVRENETRAFACGIHVERVRLVAFLISGALSGLAGALMAIHLSAVAPDSLSYHMSGQILMMALLGGMGTFFGPLVGAGVLVMMEHALSEYTRHWQLVVGSLYIALVLFFPRGIWGSIVRWVRP